ncbi:MAG: NAD(+)/NADH kinase [Patescibacteria group bacterium]
MARQIKTINFFHRQEDPRAIQWKKKISGWLKTNLPKVRIGVKSPESILVLGGDGTILEAARKHQKPIIFGLNLGRVGFLASAREPKKFLPALKEFLRGNYRPVARMILSAEVIRKGKKVFSTIALNDLAAENPLGLVEIAVNIEGEVVQNVHGTGILVATPTGSTAYNLSAHGPIIEPDIQAMIVSEILDHNLPTPSIVVRPETKLHLEITNFRKRGLLLTKDKKAADVLLISDGEAAFPLEIGDIVKIGRSPKMVTLAEVEKNYFFKSLREKFLFR